MSEPEFANDRFATTHPPRHPSYWMSTGRMLRIIFVLCCVLAVAVGLGRAVVAAREAARRAQCLCNLCQITLALHNYHVAYGSFPPAHVDDADGKPMHSWRVLLLPFMEQQTLYSAYNLSEPWDSPGNRKLVRQMPPLFACPSRHPGVSTGLTSFVAVTGPRTAFPDGRTVELDDITDGSSSTIMVAEVENVDIAWTEPRDLDVRAMSFRVNDPKRAGISSPHPGGAHVAFADGGKRFLRDRVTPAALRALCTIDGGESVDVEAALDRK